MDGRSANGGVRAGAGRKKKQTEIGLINAIDKFVNAEQLVKRLMALIDADDTKAGDKIKAIDMLLNHRYGRPMMRVESDVNVTGTEIIPVILNLGSGIDPNKDEENDCCVEKESSES